jgi:hydroxymethylpyrimidine pyrophosphatase-like HAD family hydrolase
VTTSAPGFLDVVGHGVSKGNALLTVLKQIGLASDEIIAIGDGDNDLSVFEVAGYRIAMGNSCPRLAMRADMITCDCDNDGVAAALQMLGVS